MIIPTITAPSSVRSTRPTPPALTERPPISAAVIAWNSRPVALPLLTIPSCMAGLPGLNVPCGLSEGLPVGFQLIGPQFSENTLFRVGHALEQAIGFDPVPERLR